MQTHHIITVLLPLSCRQHPVFLSFPPSSSNTHVTMRISECSKKLNLSKTEFLFIPCKNYPNVDLSVTVEDVTVLPSSMEKNLGIIPHDGLSCTPNITAVAQFWSWSSPAWTVTLSWLDSQPL